METKIFVHSEHRLLRPMKTSDIATVVQVHLQSFTGFFLTFLGSAFLRELYTAILVDPSGIGFVVERQGSVIGFVIGTEQPAGLYRRLLRQHWWRFAAASVRPLLNRPVILPRLLRAFSTPAAVTQVDKCGTLMSIAVLPCAQGSGAGKILVQAFLQEAARRGLAQVNLTTDRDGNEATNHFYQRLGFVQMSFFTTPEGRPMNKYVIDIQMGDGSVQPESQSLTCSKEDALV